MKREIIESHNRREEFVINEDGIIQFIKVTEKLNTHDIRVPEEAVEMVSVCGYGIPQSLEDVVKAGRGLQEGHFVPNGVVDFKFIDSNPKDSFANSSVGCIKTYLPSGELYAEAAHQGAGFNLVYSAGTRYMEQNTYGISMEAPAHVKKLFGKNIDDVMSNKENKDYTR